MKKEKIGIMGGSFNPFHTGHMRHAIEVMERLHLSRVELLLSAHHPHKKDLLPFDLRLAYINASIKNTPYITVNTMEKDLPPPSYTDVILQHWRKNNQDAHPYFLLGTEDFSVLKTWHNGFDLPKYAHLVIVSRLGGDARLVCKHAKKYWKEVYISFKEPKNKDFFNNIPLPAKKLKEYFIKFTKEIEKKDDTLQEAKKLFLAIPNVGYCTYLHIPHIEISATRIRKLWKNKKSIRGLVSETAYAFIKKDKAILKKYW